MTTFSKVLTAAICGCMACASVAMAQDKIPVVASFSILADMTERVGGDRVAVQTLVGPEQDAHVFQPTPAAAANVSKARLLITNGLGFEGWIDRLVASSGYKGAVVVATNGIEPLKPDEDDHHDDHKDGGEHGHGNVDPHAWQNAANALTYIENIKAGLCAADSAGCSIYTDNAAKYAAEVSALDQDIKIRMAVLPAAKRKVITSHDAFGYFAKAYGITFIAPVGMSTESEASAKDVARIIRQIRKEKVTALFVEGISDARLIEQIARETGIKAGPILYSDALSKPEGPAATYLGMMRHNADQLTRAMAGS